MATAAQHVPSLGSLDRGVAAWVDEVARLTQPDRIHWCDGSAGEYQTLERELVAKKDLLPLNPASFPGCHLHRSHPSDVARVEHLTFVCTQNRDDAGPNNHWMAPAEAHAKMDALFAGCMKGRTMYVVPYCMGPIDSPYSRCGVEITDSAYVVLNMELMTRMGRPALERIARDGKFVKGLHSTGELDPNRRFIMHFPEELSIKSFGSGYGGNALLGKKCHALRIASWQARNEGWLAEHMLIVGIENPQGETHYLACAFPSACGKTNLAMLIPPSSYKGWKVWTVGDDIAWLHPGKDGRLYAINPESGYFGVVPGTNPKTNRNAYETIRRDTIFTNVAVTADNQPWWEGLPGRQAGARLARPAVRSGATVRPRIRTRASRSQARQNPAYSKLADAPGGVPISAIVFGGRRRSLAPLVYQARSWLHGVLVGAGIGFGDDRRGNRRGRRRAPRSDGDEAVRRLQLRRLLGALDRRRRQAQIAARDLSRQLVPPGRGGQVSCGRDSARICACCAGSSIAARGSRTRAKRPSGICRDPRTWTRRDLDVAPRRRSRSCSPCRRLPGRRSSRRIGAYLAEFGERVPPALRAELEDAHGPG